MRELLRSADDAQHVEYPPNFDWAAVRERVVALKPTLEQIAGRCFVLDDHVQDATFCFDLSIQRVEEPPRRIDTVFAVRFSNFGDLFTTWSCCDVEQLPGPIASKLVDATSEVGFRFVPPEALDEPYSGSHPFFSGSKWWFRFFDYT